MCARRMLLFTLLVTHIDIMHRNSVSPSPSSTSAASNPSSPISKATLAIDPFISATMPSAAYSKPSAE